MPLPRFLFCLALLAGPAAGAEPGTFISDAFGIVPAAQHAQAGRDRWAGRLEVLTAGSVTPDRIEPDRRAETLLAFVGPKSARAGQDRVHHVALAVDRFGNLLPDGLNVRLQPGFGPLHTARTLDGIADIMFHPPVEARMYHAGATMGAVQSARAEYRVIPDLDRVTLALEDRQGALVQETLDVVESAPIADIYGNTVEAGVAVDLVLAHADGAVSRLDGVTTGDAASLPILVRGLASDMRARLSLGPVTSTEMPIELQKITLQAAPRVVWSDLPGISGMHLRAGPFLTSAGHLLNDGSAVSLSLRLADDSSRTAEGWVLDGMFHAIIPAGPDLLPAELQIEAGGSTARVSLDRTHRQDRVQARWQE